MLISKRDWLFCNYSDIQKKNSQLELKLFFLSIFKIIQSCYDFTLEKPVHCNVKIKILSLCDISTTLLFTTKSCHSSLTRENNLMPFHTLHLFFFFFSFHEKCTDFKTTQTKIPQTHTNTPAARLPCLLNMLSVLLLLLFQRKLHIPQTEKNSHF